MTDDEERWLPLPWAPDYEVSDCARVRTWLRPGNCHPRIGEWRVLRTTPWLFGTTYAYLPSRSDGKSRPQNVRRVMDMVFDGEAPA